MVALPEKYTALAAELKEYEALLMGAYDKAVALQEIVEALYPTKYLRESEREEDRRIVAEVDAEIEAAQKLLKHPDTIMEGIERSERATARLTVVPEVVVQSDWVDHHIHTDSNRIRVDFSEDVTQRNMERVVRHLLNTTALDEPRPDLYITRIGYIGALEDEGRGDVGATQRYTDFMLEQQMATHEDLEYISEHLVNVHPVQYMVALAEARLDYVEGILTEERGDLPAAEFGDASTLIDGLRSDLTLLRAAGDSLTETARNVNGLG